MLVGLLLAAGCGQQPPQATQGSTPEAVPVPEPTGPCDQDHRDHAIAVARAALRARLGGTRLSRPRAEYEHIVLATRMRGQPAHPADVGWMVSFLVEDGADASASTPATALPDLPPTSIAPVSSHGGAETSLPDPRIQSAARAPAPEQPAQAQPPTPPGTLQNGTVPAIPSRPSLEPTEVAGAHREGEFVRVDGTVLDR